jgi:1-acyl-sn-glycerol-3-phosphate acyltransferase
MSRLSSLLIGGLSFVAFVANTLFWFLPLTLVALVRVLAPWPPLVRACRATAHAIASAWIGLNVLGLKAGGRMQWEVRQPHDVRPDAWYLVTCNHRSWVDIVVLQWLFNRRLPMLTFFLKRELFWVPALGLAWWALEFPFMRRYPRAVLDERPDLRQKDFDTTRSACERFRQAPVCVLNFLEGTRFTAEKRDRQASPFRHLLLPRAGGTAQVVSTLGDRLHAWLDVTIVYPAGTPTFWHLISGQIPRVRVHVEAIAIDPAWLGRDYLADEAFRDGFQAFVRELWMRKDARIGAMLGALADLPA